MGTPPAGTVTFLFTDIEGSTQLWEEDPEAMRIALARHDSILKEEIESNHGHIIKTTGDGVHAVFEKAVEAVNAAMGAQRVLQTSEVLKTSEVSLHVRMGLHTGEAELRDNDYYGQTLNRAAVAHQLECLAFIAKALEQAERATRLLGAAEALRQRIQIDMNPLEREEYEKEIADLKANVDEKVFASLWMEGRSMTMDEAMELALE